ncbi:MAG: IS630 family transposase [Rhodothermales bacterium]
MSRKFYRVTLTEEERQDLEEIIQKGRYKATRLKRAYILRAADESPGGLAMTDEQIAQAYHTTTRTLERLRKRFVEDGFEIALNGKPRPPRLDKKIDGDVEAHVIALSRSSPPKGRHRWTFALLAERVVALGYVESVSGESVRQILKNNKLKLWRNRAWVIPPKQSSRFVCKMEQVLKVYKRPYDPSCPVVGFDESPKQLIKETRCPIHCTDGTRLYDYEYERKGVANIFLAVEPLAGKRQVRVYAQRTKAQFVSFMRYLAEEIYPEAALITVVMDNLNTHTKASFYEYLPAHEASCLADRFEFIFTPEHGSWLNVAEIELAVLQGQCLNCRMDDQAWVADEALAWASARNASEQRIDWQFQTQDARIKLKHLYPTL